MRFEMRMTPEGTPYHRFLVEREGELPTFPSYAAKEAAILDWKELYAEGRAVRGVYRSASAKGELVCVAGANEVLGWGLGLPREMQQGMNWMRALVEANNQGPSGYGGGKPVTPEGFAEVLDLLQRCPVR